MNSKKSLALHILGWCKPKRTSTSPWNSSILFPYEWSQKKNWKSTHLKSSIVEVSISTSQSMVFSSYINRFFVICQTLLDLGVVPRQTISSFFYHTTMYKTPKLHCLMFELNSPYLLPSLIPTMKNVVWDRIDLKSNIVKVSISTFQTMVFSSRIKIDSSSFVKHF